jgi:tetratricopeptide (TPR) repeat protein
MRPSTRVLAPLRRAAHPAPGPARGRILLQKARRRGESFGPAQTVLVAAREGRDETARACAVDQLGLMAFYKKILKDEGSWDDADRLFREGLALRERLDDGGDVAESLFHVGLVEQMSGRKEAARPHLEAAMAKARAAGVPRLLAECERHLAADAEERKDLPARPGARRPGRGARRGRAAPRVAAEHRRRGARARRRTVTPTAAGHKTRMPGASRPVAATYSS